MKPTIELSMIVKNGAAVLARCLRSAHPAVDRIIIGDTGSTDESPAIGREHGAEVFSIPWEENFARARNRVLEQRKCDWILVLDADEMLDGSGRAEIRSLIEAADIYAYHNPRWNYMRDASTRLGFQAARPNPVVLEEARAYPAYVPLPTTRLFRSHAGIYYEGCVHETVTRRVAALGFATGRAGFVVHHFGHGEDTDVERTRKNDLYHALGERKLEENPSDAQTMIELGLAELEHARKPAAALEFFERACRLSPESAAGWLFAGVCLVRLMRLPEGLESLDRGAKLGLRNSVYYQALADAHFHAGRYAQASEAYAQVAALGEESPLSAAKRGASEVHLGLTDQGIRRMKRAVQEAPAFGELYDILAAGALLGGELELAAQTAEMRLGIGAPTEFHFNLAALLHAQLNDRQREQRAELIKRDRHSEQPQMLLTHPRREPPHQGAIRPSSS